MNLCFNPRGFACKTAYDVCRMIRFLLTAQGSPWEYKENEVLERLKRITATEFTSNALVNPTIFGRELFKHTYFRVGVIRLPEAYSARYGIMLFNGDTEKSLLEAEKNLSESGRFLRGFSDITLEFPLTQPDKTRLVLPIFPDLSKVLRALNSYAIKELGEESVKERTSQGIAKSFEKHSQHIISGLTMKLYPPMPDLSLFTIGVEQSTTTGARDIAWAISHITFDDGDSLVLHIHEGVAPANPIQLVISYVSGVKIRDNEYLPLFNLTNAYKVLALFSQFAPAPYTFSAEL